MVKDIRLVLADDHALVRAGICALLEKMRGVSLVGEARDGREAFEQVKALAPDVALFDAMMPGLNCIDAARLVSAKYPTVKVIILSVHGAEEYVMRARQAGAAGYLLKEGTPHELELALKAVMRGEEYLSPAIPRAMLSRHLEQVGTNGTLLDILSPRQREIAQLIGEGNSTKEIAHMLQVSPKTVEAHRVQLMLRLGIRDVPGLVRWGIRMGLVEVER